MKSQQSASKVACPFLFIGSPRVYALKANSFWTTIPDAFCKEENPSFSSAILKSEYLSNNQLIWNNTTANFMYNSESNVIKITFFTKNILQYNTWKGLPEGFVLLVQTETEK